MIEPAIYALLTILIPLKQTYDSSCFKSAAGLRLWAVYWAFFAIFKSVQWNMACLQTTPVDFLFLLCALWIYNDTYKVALYPI